MVGFVGVRARKRSRNRYLFIIFIIAIFGIFFYLPSLDFTTEKKQPLDEIIPSNVVDESSLRTEIEELKLEVFQKNQRLKFRDDQIKNLKEEINDLNISIDLVKTEYEKSINNMLDLQNNSLKNDSINIEQLNDLNNQINYLNNQISEYKNQIVELEKKLNNSLSSEELEKINIENSILKSEIKQIKQNNSSNKKKLDELKNIIIEKDDEIKIKNKEIKDLIYLKDLHHHG